MGLELSLFGPFAASWAGRSLTLSAVASRVLLALLAVEPGQPRSRAELARMLWPEQPQAAASASLRQAVARLRRAVPEPDAVLAVSRHTLQIGNAVTVDVTRFADLVAECAVHDHPAASACAACTVRWEQAAALYRGEFCQGLFLRGSQPVDHWLLLTRERLQRQAVAVLHTLALRYEAAGDHPAMRDTARRVLEFEPWREEAHRQVMSALAALRDNRGALAQYRRCEQVLAAELGVVPDPQTTALADRIRAGVALPRRPAPVQPPSEGAPGTGTVHGRSAEHTWQHRTLDDPSANVLDVVGLGGVGTTTHVADAVRAVAPRFEAVVRRSLRHTPPPHTLLRGVLPALAGADPTELPADLDGLLELLLALLYERRRLLGAQAGWPAGYDGYGHLDLDPTGTVAGRPGARGDRVEDPSGSTRTRLG